MSGWTVQLCKTNSLDVNPSLPPHAWHNLDTELQKHVMTQDKMQSRWSGQTSYLASSYMYAR